MSNKSQIINPPHSLGKAIVGDGPPKLDSGLLKQAEQAISALEGGFSDLAAVSLAEIRSALARADANRDDAAAELSTIFTLVMDLKGQGATYDYMMLTEIGDLLKKFTEGRKELTGRDIKIIGAHIDAMQAVLRDEIKGDGGAVGRQIVGNLHQLTQAKK